MASSTASYNSSSAPGRTCAASARPSSLRTPASWSGLGWRFGQRAAQELRRTLGCAAQDGPFGCGAQRIDGCGLARGLAAQEVQPDGFGVGPFAGQHRSGPTVEQGAFAGGHAAVDGAGDEGVGERVAVPVDREQPDRHQPVGQSLGVDGTDSGEGADLSQRGAAAHHREVARASGTAPLGSRESWTSTLRVTCSGPNAVSRAASSAVGSTPSATSWSTRAPSRNGLPALTA